MKRVTRLEGRSATRSAPATYTLPDGHYSVPTGDGGIIRLTVSHGPAGVGISIVGPAHDSLKVVAEPGAPRVTTRDVDVSYYSPIDAYAQAFARWYDAPDEHPYMTREAFEATR